MAVLNKKTKNQHWLYIDESSLSILVISQNKDSLPTMYVKAQLSVQTPLEQPLKYAAWVQQFVKGRLNILLAHSLYRLILSDIPDVPPAELRGAIEIKAEDLLPFPIDQASLDVIHLPPEIYRGRMRMAFIVAMQSPPLRDWLMQLVAAGIAVDVIDIEVTQLRNFAVYHQKYNSSGILHLRANKSLLLLHYNNEMVLCRDFDIGLSNVLADQVVHDGELELTVADETQSEIQIAALVLEIHRSFDYYESQLGLGVVAELQFICDASQEAFAQELERRLGNRFVIKRLADFMQLSAYGDDVNLNAYHSVAGLVYRGALQ